MTEEENKEQQKEGLCLITIQESGMANIYINTTCSSVEVFERMLPHMLSEKDNSLEATRFTNTLECALREDTWWTKEDLQIMTDDLKKYDDTFTLDDLKKLRESINEWKRVSYAEHGKMILAGEKFRTFVCTAWC
jgi:hypothetical protein